MEARPDVKGDDVAWDRVLSCREFWFLYYELALDWDSKQGRKKWGMRPHTEQTIHALDELLDGHEVHIPLPKGYTLSIVFNEAGACHRLYLLHGRRRQLLGWVDAHFHPDVFRWPEFCKIVAAACAMRGARLRRAAVYVLLFMYIGFSEADNLQAIARDYRRELANLGLFSAREVGLFAAWLTDPQSRAGELKWVQEPGCGWVVEGGYSLRTLEPGYQFDFKAFGRFIQDYDK
jgi:hypothetical protein